MTGFLCPGEQRWLRQWNIPVEPGVHAQVLLPWPMTEENWRQFWAVLDAMKPGLVAGREHAPECDGSLDAVLICQACADLVPLGRPAGRDAGNGGTP